VETRFAAAAELWRWDEKGVQSQKVARTPHAKDGKDEKVWTGGEKATPVHLPEKYIVGVGYKAFRPILCALCVRHLLNEFPRHCYTS